MTSAPAYEFDCSECGQHIVSVAGPEPVPFNLCATCVHLPGWVDDPELVRILAPDRAPAVPS